ELVRDHAPRRANEHGVVDRPPEQEVFRHVLHAERSREPSQAIPRTALLQQRDVGTVFRDERRDAPNSETKRLHVVDEDPDAHPQSGRTDIASSKPSIASTTAPGSTNMWKWPAWSAAVAQPRSPASSSNGSYGDDKRR